MKLTKEMFRDFNLEQVMASRGDFRLWGKFSPYYGEPIYKIEWLKTHQIIMRMTSFETALEEFNKLV